MFNGTISDFFNVIVTGLKNFRLTDAIDILIMTIVLFWLISFFRKMGATQLLRGLLTVIILFYLISNLFELTMISWLLDKLLISGFLFIAIVFQPEIRRALDHLGRQRISLAGDKSNYNELIKALKSLSRRSVGALVLIEKSENLEDIIETGVKIDAIITSELVQNIFEDKTPLHDGAVVIRDGRLEAASCIIPLNNQLPRVPQKYGTRHRAAVSATMKSDCVAIVVSEETGKIAYAQEGELFEEIDSVQLVNLVNSLIDDESIQSSGLFKKLFNKPLRKESTGDGNEKSEK